MKLIETSQYKEAAMNQHDIQEMLEMRARMAAPTQPIIVPDAARPKKRGKGGHGPTAPNPSGPGSQPAAETLQPLPPAPAGTTPMQGPPRADNPAAMAAANASRAPSEETEVTRMMDNIMKQLAILPTQRIDTPEDGAKALQFAQVMQEMARKLQLKAQPTLPQQGSRV